MSGDQRFECPGCDHRLGAGERFCIQCGRLSPEVVERGENAIRLLDVPAAQLRETAVEILRVWFPALDAVAAAERLKTGPAVLVQGVDEQSGQRILNALKKLKLQGQLTGIAPKGSLAGRLVNPGLIVTVLAVLLDILLRGRIPLVLVLLSFAAPMVWGFFLRKVDGPLVVEWEPTPDAVLWATMAKQYADAVSRVDADLRRALGSFAEDVFDVLRGLSDDSVASVAAGGLNGALYGRLVDALRTAVDLAQRIPSTQSEEQAGLRKEFEDLRVSVSRTREWFRSAQRDRVKAAAELTEELGDVARSIDRVLDDVRSVAGPAGLSRERERV
jgi:hypothetical protein